MSNLFFRQVSTFNKDVIGYEFPTKPTKLPLEVKRLLLIQLREEIRELEQAHTLTDEVDAIIDLIYFAYGGLYKQGITEDNFGAIHTIVHSANMTKVAGKKANRGYDGTAQDAVKPLNFIPPEKVICKFLNDSEHEDNK